MQILLYVMGAEFQLKLTIWKWDSERNEFPPVFLCQSHARTSLSHAQMTCKHPTCESLPAGKVGWNLVDIWLFSGCDVDNVVSTPGFQPNFNIAIPALFQCCSNIRFQTKFQCCNSYIVSTLKQHQDFNLISTLFRLKLHCFKVGMTLFHRWNIVVFRLE